MNTRTSQIGDRLRHSIHIGGVYASRQPTAIHTVLGSCIAVCLRDPITRIGGMNHFMLPQGHGDDGDSTRYGINAMELLINECMKAGAERSRLEAKVFGGGHVLQIQETADNVPKRNIQFACQFLQTEGIPIIGRDVGGYDARKILFFTDCGRTLLKRLQREDSTALHAMRQREQSALSSLPKREIMPKNDNVTLF